MLKYLRIPSLITLLFILGGWGNTGHKIINGKSVQSFPLEMSCFKDWQIQLELHCSDADSRKGSDPSEYPKHFIDIDNYPEFISLGSIPQSYDSLVAVHGSGFVIDQGILPWAIVTCCDSLTSSFFRKDWDNAILFAADLGHYVADAHMPLHITRNYNGQLTGQTGIHSRYESTMINKYYTQIAYSPDSAVFIEDIAGYVFQFLYSDYLYVDSLLNAELLARNFAGNTTSEAYYLKFWELSKDFTTVMFSASSNTLGSLIYTSWVNAGKPLVISSLESVYDPVNTFKLSQNYPNPFNPSTTITYSLSEPGFVNITICDLKGEIILRPINSFHPAGTYKLNINGKNLPSGIYFCTALTGTEAVVRKMILVK